MSEYDMKGGKTRYIIQFASALIFSVVVLWLFPGAGGNRGAIFYQFTLRMVLASVSGIVVADALITRRRPSCLAVGAALISCFPGIIIGGLLGIFLGFLIEPLIGGYEPITEVIGMFVGPIICAVLSYNGVNHLLKHRNK